MRKFAGCILDSMTIGWGCLLEGHRASRDLPPVVIILIAHKPIRSRPFKRKSVNGKAEPTGMWFQGLWRGRGNYTHTKVRLRDINDVCCTFPTSTRKAWFTAFTFFLRPSWISNEESLNSAAPPPLGIKGQVSFLEINGDFTHRKTSTPRVLHGFSRSKFIITFFRVFMHSLW